MGLPTHLHAAGVLVGTSKSDSTQVLKSVLVSRLSQCNSILGRPEIDLRRGELEDIQLQTAKDALYLLDKIQKDISSPSSAEPLAVGTRDLANIRTLLSIVFKWGVEPLLGRVIMSWPSRPSARLPMQSKIIDLTTGPGDFKDLCTLTRQVLFLALPDGHSGPLSQTFIANALLVRHITDVLKPCISLGWLPKALSTDSMPTQNDLRDYVMRLLSLQTSQIIVALGGVMSSSPPLPPHVQRACSFLLGRQLLRPTGIRGLCAAVFGEEEVSEIEAPLEKLEHVSKVLSTIPQSIAPQDFFTATTLQLLDILSDTENKAPSTHQRAAAFSLSRMLTHDYEHRSTVAGILLPLLHNPLLLDAPEIEEGVTTKADTAKKSLTPSSSISTLQLLLVNTDPSPNLVSALFTPIAPSLYTLYSYLESNKTSDPAVKEIVKGLLETWARVAASEEVVEGCWSIIDGKGGYWTADIAGELRRTDSPQQTFTLSLFTPEELKRAEESGELDIDSNLLDLRPDPVHFVGFLKSTNRSEVSSDIFVRLLEKYRESKADSDAEPLRTLLYLQLIIQIQSKLAESNSSSNILKKPEHILSFIKHSLESGVSGPLGSKTTDREAKQRQGLSLEDLRIVPGDESTIDSDDSDDESQDEENVVPEEELTVTTLNLLLAILEANSELSARKTPILIEIFALLEDLSKGPSDDIRTLAREARMVLTARLASTSTTQNKSSTRNPEEEDSVEVYQKALTLLQDPILPVRAHGLMLLRQLVSPASPGGKPSLEKALVPGVLSIFLQSVQDEDSYMFLNAVQGLAAMVDGFGKEVLRGLMNDYASGVEGGGLTQSDVDMRVRIGEALAQVIRRCDEALPLYIDILAPPLAKLVRMSYLPTTIRTSALSLLAQIANTRAIALLPYSADLFDGMIDLLQLETVPAPLSRTEEIAEVAADTMDSQPTAANSKFPPLRRAALHFLTLLIRASITRVYDTGPLGSMIPESSINRAKVVLSYVGSVDEDSIVKVMSREAREHLDQLSNALVGL